MPSYVITGASRGIGLEFARQLSSKVDNVVFGLVRNKAGSKELLELASARKNLYVVEADLSDYKSLQRAAAEVAKVTSGKLDNLVNNAAYVQLERWYWTLDKYANGEEDNLEKDFFENMNVNVLGVIHTINAFLPLLKASATAGTARVVTLSSGAGDLDLTVSSDYAAHPLYAISKAALNMAVAKFAARFREENFIFLAISPGVVNTMTSEPDAENLREIGKMMTIFKRASPQWDGIPLTPEQSVTMVLGVVAKTERKDSGAFISHFGNKRWL